MLQICLIEPYYTGSHKFWADTLVNHSRHFISLFTLKGQHWKWRMQAASIPLAEKINASDISFDLILCSDMMDLSLFKSLLKPSLQQVPLLYYMHENQLSYPYSKDDRDKDQEHHYGFINYKSCLVADHIIFNSDFHRHQFLDSLEKLLRRLPDHRSLNTLSEIKSRSKVLPIPLNLDDLLIKDTHKDKPNNPTVLLWNHRWEHDKRPDLFIDLCRKLGDDGYKFKINFLGKSSHQFKELINAFKSDFEDRMLHFGHVDSFRDYVRILQDSDVIPVTSEHDFFGISVLEAMYAGNYPLLPRDMVYEEHFINDPSEYVYDGFEMLYTKITAWLDQPVSFDPLGLRSYSIDRVIPLYDQFFTDSVLA